MKGWGENSALSLCGRVGKPLAIGAAALALAGCAHLTQKGGDSKSSSAVDASEFEYVIGVKPDGIIVILDKDGKEVAVCGHENEKLNKNCNSEETGEPASGAMRTKRHAAKTSLSAQCERREFWYQGEYFEYWVPTGCNEN